MPTAVLDDWPQGREAALSLTFDDGLSSHWEIAAPALTVREWGATFFVITDSVDWAGVVAAAAAGHEIGSHSTTTAKLVTGGSRPFALVADVDARLAESRAEIESRLAAVRPGYQTVSFAYPQGLTSAESDDTNLPTRVLETYPFARTAGGNGNATFSLDWAYRYEGAWRTPRQAGPRPDLAFGWISLSLNVGSTTPAATLSTTLGDALAARQWAVLLWHGVDASAFPTQLDAIGGVADRLWLAPFGRVAGYVAARDALLARGGPVVTAVGGGFEVSVDDGRAGDFESEPLSLLVTLPDGQTAEGWIFTQGDDSLEPVVDGSLVRLRVVPDERPVVLTPLGLPPERRVTLQAERQAEGLRLRWDERVGHTYRLETATTPAGPWLPGEPWSAETDAPAESTQPTQAEAGFWRLVETPQP